MPIRVNLIVSGDVELWRRHTDQLMDNGVSVTCSNAPVEADFTFVTSADQDLQVTTPKSRTFFCLSEPPEIITYPKGYLDQFGAVIGPKFRSYINVKHLRQSHPLLPNFVGVKFPYMPTKLAFLKLAIRSSNFRSKLQIEKIPENLPNLRESRSNKVVAFASSKKWTELQIKRIEFLEFLSASRRIDVRRYGTGFRPIGDKSKVLRPVNFQIAIENSSHDDYWTEKLSDGILELNHTFYSGAPNIVDYFDNRSVTMIDLNNFDKSLETIEAKLEIGYDFEGQLAARNKFMNEYSPAAFIERNLTEGISDGVKSQHILRSNQFGGDLF